jgi:alpha-glucosidase
MKLPIPKLKKSGLRWADGAVVYQIYPRSFQDSNGDGIGDIPGIISRLDYLKELGVSALWLSPFYPSPMADFGYDVADYHGVDPMFGTLDDFKELLQKAHALDIKIIIDIVPNHSSDEHQWFIESSKSRDNEYSDWYVWKDPLGFEGGFPVPPNNWLDLFAGKSAWEWVEARQQFYLHTFHVRQPDLNWHNPQVRKAMLDMLRYWLEMGVDGFRVDAVPFMGKDPEYRDEPANPHYVNGRDNPYHSLQHIYSGYTDEHYTYLGMMADVLKERAFRGRKRFMITEGYTERIDPVSEYLRYYKSMDPEVAAPFIFEGIQLPWEPHVWHDFLGEFHKTLEEFSPKALASYAFGNHDQWRLVTRIGEERARSAAVLKLTLPGVIFVYYGEELGMHNVEIPKDKVQDPGAAGDIQYGQGRDPERTPMQWSADEHAGFSDGKDTWLPLSPDYKEHNVAGEEAKPNSSLNLYRRLVNLRQSEPTLTHGNFRMHSSKGHPLMAYSRNFGKESMLVLINFSDKPTTYGLSNSGHILVSSLNLPTQPEPVQGTIPLQAHEALVIRIDK